jgi:hypothetical protein
MARRGQYNQPMKLRALLILFSLSTLSAQDAGTIFGAVSDASGAVIAGAKVTLLNVDTNISQETRTDSSGEYIFTPVRIGNYTVKIDMAGFGATRRACPSTSNSACASISR